MVGQSSPWAAGPAPRRPVPGPWPACGRRRCESRRRRGRARSAARRASPRRPRGSPSSGRAARPGTSGDTTGRSPCRTSTPRPQRTNAERQLFGGPPSGAPSRQTYQSRFGLSRLERDAWNHGCWSEVWFGTQSSTTLMSRRAHSATRRRSRPACRTPGRRRSSRRRRSRSRPSGRGRSATATPPHPERRAGGRGGRDAAQVADAVAVAVGEGPRVDLVDRAALPPRQVRHGRHPTGGLRLLVRWDGGHR